MALQDRLNYWQRRARHAEYMLQFSEREMESNRRWAQNAFEGERRLARRCEFLYGKAIQHGATTDELRGE